MSAISATKRTIGPRDGVPALRKPPGNVAGAHTNTGKRVASRGEASGSDALRPEAGIRWPWCSDDGYLTLRIRPSRGDEAFVQALRELGYVEGSNLIIDYRWAAEDMQRLPSLAAELVALNVDVIVTSTTPPAILAPPSIFPDADCSSAMHVLQLE